MPLKRLSKFKPSSPVSSDHVREDLVDEESSGRKRSVSAASDGSEVVISQTSPSKRFKKAIPGSPEYVSQHPVTTTARRNPKPINRKLSFGSIEEDASKQPGSLDNSELAPPAFEEEKRSRKMSEKALYMVAAESQGSSDKRLQSTPAKKHVGHQQKGNPAKADTMVMSPSRSSNRKTAPSVAVKEEHVSEDDLRSLSPFKLSRAKEKSRARMTSPIEISSEDDGHNRPTAIDTSRLSPTLSAVNVSDSDAEETPKPAKKGNKFPAKSLSVHHRESSITSPALDLLPSYIPSPGDEAVFDSSDDFAFIIHPSDPMKGPAYAPKDLRDPETDKPIFLQPHAFEAMFEPPTLTSLLAAAGFELCTPFVNPARVSPDTLSVGDYKQMVWPGSKQNAIFTMLGAVTSCNIINSTTIGNHRYRAVTIIPHAPSFAGFTSFLGRKYGCDEMFGPFEFGCQLTFSSRREGLSSAYGTATLVQNTKRNMKAFGSCANAPPAALWFDKQFPPFMNFDQEIPIYDARSLPFSYLKEDFIRLPSLPLYKKHGDRKQADLPPNALVTVFFSLNAYTSTRAPPTPSSHKMSARGDSQAPVASGSSRRDNTYSPAKGNSAQSDNASKIGSSQVLSPNLQFLIYHGLIPEDDD